MRAKPKPFSQPPHRQKQAGQGISRSGAPTIRIRRLPALKPAAVGKFAEHIVNGGIKLDGPMAVQVGLVKARWENAGESHGIKILTDFRRTKAFQFIRTAIKKELDSRPVEEPDQARHFPTRFRGLTLEKLTHQTLEYHQRNKKYGGSPFERELVSLALGDLEKEQKKKRLKRR